MALQRTMDRLDSADRTESNLNPGVALRNERYVVRGRYPDSSVAEDPAGRLPILMYSGLLARLNRFTVAGAAPG